MSCSESSKEEGEIRRFTGTVPEDLVSNILLRLPSKDLVGLKVVSKSWRSLISSPNFTKSHLAITSAEEKEDIHIIHSCEYKDSISLINLSSPQLVVTHLNFPSMLCAKLIGSACGIVCFRSTIGDCSRMYLWNHATNQSKLIHNPSSRSDEEALGFGFDEINNDFKIVRVVWELKPACFEKKYRAGCYAEDCEDIYVEVYSSNRNAWRQLRGKPTDLPYLKGNFDVSVNTGVLCAGGCNGIITFDLHTEVLTCSAVNYPVPTFDANINNFNDARGGHALVTSNFKDSIAVIIYKHGNRRYNNTHEFNLWALDNVACLRGGGIEASWTLIFNIDVKLPIFRVHGCLNSGDLLLELLTRESCLYNSDSKEARYFNDSFYFDQIFKYSKSLFTIPGFKQVDWPWDAPPS